MGEGMTKGMARNIVANRGVKGGGGVHQTTKRNEEGTIVPKEPAYLQGIVVIRDLAAHAARLFLAERASESF